MRVYGVVYLRIYDALRHVLPFVQSKKREEHPWRSVTFSKVAGFNLGGDIGKKTFGDGQG